MRVFAVVAVLAASLIGPSSTHAQGCQPGAFRQDDMAGIYISEASPMRVQIYPCGGAHVLWDNQFGRHSAGYTGRQRMSEGGIIAVGLIPDPAVGYLDNAYTIAFKPAEPGMIEVITASPYGVIVGVYSLRKLT